MAHKKNKSIEAKTKKAIDTTIDTLEATIRNQKKKSIQQHHTPIYNDSQYRFRKNMVLVTVAIIGIGVFGMWGWHMRTVLYDANRGSLGIETPLDSVGKYFNEAMLISGKNDTNTMPLLPTTSSVNITTDISSSSEQISTIKEENTIEKKEATSTLDAIINSLQSELTSSTVTTTQ